MLVDVVELDAGERPRDPAEVRAALPVRGLIQADRLWTDRDLARAPVHVDIRPMALETLYSVRLRYWKGVNIVLEGWQRQAAKGYQTGGARFPQRWWVVIVLDPATPPMSFNDRRRLRRERQAASRGRLQQVSLGPAPRHQAGQHAAAATHPLGQLDADAVPVSRECTLAQR